MGHTNVGSIAYVFPDGPLVGEKKLPNLSLEVTSNPMPRVIFKNGWSESFNQLQEDMMDWFIGGNGAIQAVFLLKWSKPSTSVSVCGLVKL